MSKLAALLAGFAAFAVTASAATAAPWSSSVPFTNTVVSSPVTGGGYPVPPGATRPDPGTCGPQQLNSNHSESWLAVKPGTEDLVGVSKFFVGKWSTFYNFHLGSYTIQNGAAVATNEVQGYECTTVGTQAMPPSWTNNTDPNADFDTQGRVYQTTLPFNAFWAGGMHPNGEIDVSYSDDLGRHWVKANGGVALDNTNNQNSVTLGHVDDKQWIAVNHIVGNVNQDHVYAMWTTFNGANGNGKIMVSVSRDRGATFSKAVQLTTPSETTPGNTYVYPSIGPDGTVYVAFIGGFDLNKNKVGHVYVTKSTDDGRTWAPFVVAASPIERATNFANSSFRDGILENFTASPTYPGHAYLVYENWDPATGTSDVYLTQTVDGGFTWSSPQLVNDDANTASSDQFQPSVAAGPGGAVAVAFYDRRAACPADASILPAHQGGANTCIAVSLQAYRDTGSASGAQPAGSNVDISTFLWDPDQPAQKVDGISQYPCAGHNDPCPRGRGFIGDYFGLAISNANIYALSVSTHYPGSGVTADDGGPVYYQQQVLARVSRAAVGI